MVIFVNNQKNNLLVGLVDQELVKWDPVLDIEHCAGTGRRLGDADPYAGVPGGAGELHGGDPAAVATRRHAPQHPEDPVVQQLRRSSGGRRKIPTQVTSNSG